MTFALCTTLLLSVLCFHAQAAGTIDFLVIGDWGGKISAPHYTVAEKSVAASMGRTAAAIGSKFVISLGDNFYNFGVSNAHDPRFQSTFENVFTARSLQSRWYVVCGNHDHYGNASAQIAYTQLSRRWYMPNFYYTQTMTIPDTKVTVQFIFIDTVILCGPTDPFLAPRDRWSKTEADEHWAWIRKTLRQSTADWIIMSGHYPVWSIAEHGPTQLMVQKLRPLLKQYRVSAYFSGHDHSLQHIVEDGGDVHYFVCGAGHLTDNSQKNMNNIPPDSLRFHYAPLDLFSSHGGYASVSISPSDMSVTFYDASATRLYTTKLRRPRRMLHGVERHMA